LKDRRLPGPEIDERLSVRPPQLSDSRALAEAELVCFSDPWPAQFFVSEILADGRFNRLLVDPSGNMVAYLICAWQYLDLHVLKVATLPPHRRSGLARRLMAIAEDHAVEMGGESLTLEVRISNDVAIALYKALGYHQAGVRRGYYQDGEDAVIMSKRLSNSEF
jgi:ribosomal-protein-alanine N-acetyltransferase